MSIFNNQQQTPINLEEKQERVDSLLRASRDSVWLINHEVQNKINNGELTIEMRNILERNILHLQYVVENDDVIQMGGDISDLVAAIATGKAALEE